MKKVKLIIFISLIILFIIVLFYSIFGTSLSHLSVKDIKEDRKLKKDLISELKINNVDAIYDKNNNTYYYMVPENYEGNVYILNLELKDGYKYKIIDETLNIIKVDYNEFIEVIVYNDKYYFETKIQLTNLPLINIITEETISFDDTKTIFNYINSTNSEEIITSNSMMHIRGATSKYFDKKSYKINFYNKSYTDEKKVNISNFYYGDSLILDAVYRDPSKVRNVFATELWNDISNDFSNINVYSEFVEVFINSEYKGLYVLTEPINRTKLNLNKSSSIDTSVIIKTTDWRTINDIKESYSITEDTFLYYELKYPNDNDMYEKSWDIALNKLANYYNNVNSYKVIKNSFDIDNYIDIIIFNAFTNNADNNIKKNNYFYAESLKSEKLYIQPWDMEYTFGLAFYSKGENLTKKDMKDYDKIYTKFHHENSSEINKLLISRYRELRKSILTKDNFDRLLDNYKNKLNKGCALRDSNIWYEYDIEKEIEDIRTWLYNRLDYFDNYVESLDNEQV